MVSPAGPTGPRNCPPSPVGDTGLNVGRDLRPLLPGFRAPGAVLCRCGPAPEPRAGGGDTYLVRPREGRISTIKIKNM